MSKTFSIISLGCFRNTYDSELIADEFIKKGYVLDKEAEKLETIIINTCAFINSAKEESIGAIKDALELKRKGRIKKVLVRGCLVTRYQQELSTSFPGVDGWEGVLSFSCFFNFGGRKKDRVSHVEFLKISEGCSNRCSYCAIPLIKGPLKSKHEDAVLKEVEFLDRKGAKELNIIGQDITAWGKDIYAGKDLVFILKKILRQAKNIRWFRLLYTHPKNFTDSLIDLISREKRLCKYIDLPIQHVNDRILKLMNRGITRREMVNLIKKVRKKIPGSFIRTSVIVGFPSETEEEFTELLEFVREIKFERLGVFIYSREDRTPAYGFPSQIHHKTKERRYRELMEVQKEISLEVNKRFLGKQVEVLLDEKQSDMYIGRTQFSCYDIDGIVYLPCGMRAQGVSLTKSQSRLRKTTPKLKDLKVGKFYKTTIIDAYEYDLVGV